MISTSIYNLRLSLVLVLLRCFSSSTLTSAFTTTALHSTFKWNLSLSQGHSSNSEFSSGDNIKIDAAMRKNDVGFGESRRSFFKVSSIMSSALITSNAVLSSENTAYAKDELFKKNPLTNPLLEQIRIWEQAEADDIKYNGELAPGDAGNRGKVDAYPRLLVPILLMNDEMKKVNYFITCSSPPSKNNDKIDTNWKQAYEIISQSKFEKVAFKRTFNAFGDNIYYSDPDRANLYLGGGTTPKSEQSMAYLQRNEILTNIEDLKAELEYMLSDKTPLSDKEDLSELIKLSSNAITAFDGYLGLVPPRELERAQEIMAEESS